MHVDKILFIVLKERGFDKCNFNSDCSTTQGLHNYTPDYDNGLYIPNEEVLNWIFDSHKMYLYNEHGFKETLENLKFWYITLLKHNFKLMYEFIGRLEKWFENNNCYYLTTDLQPIKADYFPTTIKDDNGICWCLKNTNDKYFTKEEAKHKIILKIFELLKDK